MPTPPTHRVSHFNPDFVAALQRQRLPGGGALYSAGPSPARILFVHGAFHGAWCFGAWMAALSTRGIGCAAVDFRGHGFLAHEGLPLTTNVADYASTVQEAAAACGSAVTIVGHSLGALAVARASTLVDAAAMVLLAPSPPANLPGAVRVPPRPDHMLVAVPPLDESADRYLGGASPVWVEKFHSLLCPEAPAALNDRYELRVTVDPAAMPAKTFIVAAGRDDRLRHPDGQDAAIARLFGADYLMLDDAPHCMMLGEHSAAVLDCIVDWLALSAIR